MSELAQQVLPVWLSVPGWLPLPGLLSLSLCKRHNFCTEDHCRSSPSQNLEQSSGTWSRIHLSQLAMAMEKPPMAMEKPPMVMEMEKVPPPYHPFPF